LSYDDHPASFQAADAASVLGQRSYLRAVLARLLLALLAAMAAAFTLRIGSKQTDIFAIVTMMAFVAALAADVMILQDRPNRIWYQARALAESVKTLTWRYVAGGLPFPADTDSQETDSLFLQRLHELRRDLPDLPLVPSQGDEITEPMRVLRHSSLDDRKRAYLNDRITDQQLWYAAKGAFHKRRAALFGSLTVILEAGGVFGALLEAIGVLNFDLAGVAAAAVACIAAWSATRQHATNANAYTLATHELGLARENLRRARDETTWVTAVADAEAAISREHSTWRSSHS
jgi:hypothetical protein